MQKHKQVKDPEQIKFKKQLDACPYCGCKVEEIDFENCKVFCAECKRENPFYE